MSRLDLRFDYPEERWVTVGIIQGVLLAVVAHTIRETKDGDIIRIISARKADKVHRRWYREASGGGFFFSPAGRFSNSLGLRRVKRAATPGKAKKTAHAEGVD